VRLTRDQVEAITQSLVHALVREGTISTDEPGGVTDRLSAVFLEDLAVEDKLNEEVREVLIQHSSEMERSNITYTEMFKMVKRKLAKEKGIVL